MGDSAASSLTQRAYEQLRSDLLSCRIPPGARLRINDLCQQLSVSLGAVREALSRLTSEGLVVLEPQRGFRVAPISVAELRDLTRVRIEIEGLCLRCAFVKGDTAWEAEMLAAFHRLSCMPQRVPSDPRRISEPWVALHKAFHASLVSACDSPWLLRIRETLFAQSERYRSLSIPLARAPRDPNQEHRELMEAALARDADRAVALMREHLEATARIVLGGDAVLPGAADSGASAAS